MDAESEKIEGHPPIRPGPRAHPDFERRFREDFNRDPVFTGKLLGLEDEDLDARYLAAPQHDPKASTLLVQLMLFGLPQYPTCRNRSLDCEDPRFDATHECCDWNACFGCCGGACHRDIEPSFKDHYPLLVGPTQYEVLVALEGLYKTFFDEDVPLDKDWRCFGENDKSEPIFVSAYGDEGFRMWDERVVYTL